MQSVRYFYRFIIICYVVSTHWFKRVNRSDTCSSNHLVRDWLTAWTLHILISIVWTVHFNWLQSCVTPLRSPNLPTATQSSFWANQNNGRLNFHFLPLFNLCKCRWVYWVVCLVKRCCFVPLQLYRYGVKLYPSFFQAILQQLAVIIHSSSMLILQYSNLVIPNTFSLLESRSVPICNYKRQIEQYEK